MVLFWFFPILLSVVQSDLFVRPRARQSTGLLAPYLRCNSTRSSSLNSDSLARIVVCWDAWWLCFSRLPLDRQQDAARGRFRLCILLRFFPLPSSFAPGNRNSDRRSPCCVVLQPCSFQNILRTEGDTRDSYASRRRSVCVFLPLCLRDDPIFSAFGASLQGPTEQGRAPKPTPGMDTFLGLKMKSLGARTLWEPRTLFDSFAWRAWALLSPR